MQPRMEASEVVLLSAFLRCASRFLEFGSGGSTVLACGAGPERVVSVDSSAEWQAKTVDECKRLETKVQPIMILVDIGPTGEWGYPTAEATRARWPDYHRSAWELTSEHQFDLCLID